MYSGENLTKTKRRGEANHSQRETPKRGNNYNKKKEVFE